MQITYVFIFHRPIFHVPESSTRLRVFFLSISTFGCCIKRLVLYFWDSRRHLCLSYIHTPPPLSRAYFFFFAVPHPRLPLLSPRSRSVVHSSRHGHSVLLTFALRTPRCSLHFGVCIVLSCLRRLLSRIVRFYCPRAVGILFFHYSFRYFLLVFFFHFFVLLSSKKRVGIPGSTIITESCRPSLELSLFILLVMCMLQWCTN